MKVRNRTWSRWNVSICDEEPAAGGVEPGWPPWPSYDGPSVFPPGLPAGVHSLSLTSAVTTERQAA